MTPREIDPSGRAPHESSGRAGAISRFFIERPVLSNVIALVVVLIGLVALIQLPSSQYPNVVPPTVQVTTRYPGASARTLVDSVALPIEQQVNGVENMLYMQSTSADDGTYTLAVTFAIGTNPDLAQVLVQNRVAIAFSSLPQEVQLQGVTTKKQSTSILEFVNLSSPDSRFDSLFLSNYAVINVQDELRRLNGVGDVTVLGAGQYAMRIWLNPDLLQARGLTPQDVINIIQQQSQEVTAGQVGAPPAPKGQDFQYTLNLIGRLDDPAQFENIIVKVDPANGGRITRIRDIGHAELGAQTYSESFNLDGRPAAGIAISLLPEANAIAVSNEVKAKMDELAKSFPEGLVYGIPYDTTKFVRAAIFEVYRTLIEAAILVLIVILVFLQDWRAMLVPATTVPVTLIGAFAAMAALGFSVNLPTLFALVLAIGIVVDDAIVIVEGVARYIEQKLPGREAAERAMDDLTGPVLGITLVLMSVFIPAAFVPGLTGQLYRQFALVIAATAFISAVNALTLKPTQSALWLRPPKPPEQRNLFTRGFDAVYGAVERGYARLVGAMTRRAGAMVVLALALVGVAVYGLTRVPTAFLPTEDQGYLIVPAQLPDGASKERTDAVMQQISKIASKIPGVEHVVTVSGILHPRQPGEPRQRRRRLRRPQGLGRAPQGAGTGCPLDRPAPERRPARRAGSDRIRAPSAADSGHRQRRRLHHAGRAQKRQFRLRPASEPDQRRRRGWQRAILPTEGRHDLPGGRAAVLRQGRPDQGRDGSASRWARCSPPFRAMSERAMWPNSTNSDTSSRSIRRRCRATVRPPTTSATSR